MINWLGLYTLSSREVSRFLRTSVQSLFAPWINSILYILVFGYIVGSRVHFGNNIVYVNFVLPGILLLNVATAAFLQTSFSLYLYRFQNIIEEITMAPLSSYEIIFGFLIGGIARAICVGIGIYVIALLFGISEMTHIGLFILYILLVSCILSCLGIIKGLWSESFEQLSLFQTFLITPLVFLGGMFQTIEMLPEQIRFLVYINPFFYFVDGVRYSMIGYQESTPTIRLTILISLTIISFLFATYLVKKGYKIRK